MKKKKRLIEDVVAGLHRVLGEGLVSVVLYGPGAHGDDYAAVADRNLMIVLADLEPETLELAAEPIRAWLRKDQPWPRLFSPATIAASADVFPIEFLDIAHHHRVVHGSNPFVDLVVETPHLRLQCERELREKVMRLREGFVESVGRNKALRSLLAASYPSFAFTFRGCLHLLGESVPARDDEVVAILCRLLELDDKPFRAVSSLADGGSPLSFEDELEVYTAYVRQLAHAIERIDGLATVSQGETT